MQNISEQTEIITSYAIYITIAYLAIKSYKKIRIYLSKRKRENIFEGKESKEAVGELMKKKE